MTWRSLTMIGRLMNKRPRSAAIALSAAIFAGGAVGPDYRKPHTQSPAAYGEAHTGPTTLPSVGIDLTQWWNTFNDPELNSLIQRAVESNYDLLTAEARVREARASLGAQVANLFP